MRTSPVVYVFATDVKGYHDNSDAQRAVSEWEALPGVGEGFSGRSYAIPVYDTEGNVRPIEQLRGPVRRFLEFVQENQQYTYNVTRLGCGPFGYDDFDVAPYFTDAPKCVILPVGWRTHYQDIGNKR